MVSQLVSFSAPAMLTQGCLQGYSNNKQMSPTDIHKILKDFLFSTYFMEVS